MLLRIAEEMKLSTFIAIYLNYILLPSQEYYYKNKKNINIYSNKAEVLRIITCIVEIAGIGKIFLQFEREVKKNIEKKFVI